MTLYLPISSECMSLKIYGLIWGLWL